LFPERAQLKMQSTTLLTQETQKGAMRLQAFYDISQHVFSLVINR